MNTTDIQHLTRSLQRLLPLAAVVHDTLHNGGNQCAINAIIAFGRKQPVLKVYLPASRVWETLEVEPLTQNDANNIYEMAWLLHGGCERGEIRG